jgi:hypothetical protein
MRTQVDQSRHFLVWIASVATTLFCAAIAVFIAWTPTATGNPKDHTTLAELSPLSAKPAAATGDKAFAGVVSEIPARLACAECGLIESVREIRTRGEQTAESTASYEFTIRFRDGSRRVLNEATPRTWRPGTKVKVID